MHHPKKTRTIRSAKRVENLTRRVMNQAAELAQRTEKLHESVGRAENIHHEVEENIQKAKQNVKRAKRRRRAA